jgi:uncharacterized protein YuzE
MRPKPRANLAQTMRNGKVALAEIHDYATLLPLLKKAPDRQLWCSYDQEADVLYVTFRRPPKVTDSELTDDDDVVVRYSGDQVVGYDILHASKRL